MSPRRSIPGTYRPHSSNGYRIRRAAPLPASAFGKWYAGLDIDDGCRCAHDVGAHGSETMRCTICRCETFRPVVTL